MKKENPKKLKLLLCALSGSVVIGGCGNVKNSSSEKKEAQSASNIEKNIENNNEISTNEYKEIETTQHNEITEPETKTEVQTEAPTKKLTALNTELHGYSDAEKIMNYSEQSNEIIINGTPDINTCKNFLIERVDFIFYNKDIFGVYYNSITKFDQLAYIFGSNRYFIYIESNYPEAIESLPENYSAIYRELENNTEYLNEIERKLWDRKLNDNEADNFIEEIKGYADINKEK